MQLFLYNIFIQLYYSLIYLFSFFNAKAKLFVRGRETIFKDLSSRFQPKQVPLAWFHCASLGEFEQGRPVIEAFKAQFPTYQILLTFFSPSGYEVKKNDAIADIICYLPMDTAKNAERFLQITQPKIAFFVKYEFWYHFIYQTSQRNIPLVSFSAIFRKEQIFFKPHGALFRSLLKKFTHIFVQNQSSLNLLQSIGIQQVSLSGDTRFDRVWAIKEANREIPIANIFKNNEKLIVIGSSWKEDISVISRALQHFPYPIKLIIAPHEINENTLQYIENQFFYRKVIRFSQAKSLTNAQELASFDLLLIDNVGMLSALYRYGEYAFVGGGYAQGLHNILEPAVFGMPIFFGNLAYQKFSEATQLEKLGVAFPIKKAEDLKNKLIFFVENPQAKKKTDTDCITFVKENLGSTDKILAYLTNFLSFQ
ncbi:3-deoxy-D-manno-octulosonic acid transferase [Thermoflexibacter ruber]|uniref:3-deoxy-D-manno-octulosonic acid transferase n=1 Tax=Thermoflexibacter ruber TaxID=1003 RepID=A0A1I2DP28_9BACT|nr:glycosyltransferase N-terminal domain-containing protein [Thermoflexibacter ruber]SFE82256.1 3-deoxy-D-manno-octulosonic-acid transferase [Thermoflexibacter ruber]